MWRVRLLSAVLAGSMILVASCGSTPPMPDDEVAACAEAAREEGSLGGSSQLVSSLVLRLPDEAVPATGIPDEGREAAFDRAFEEAYGIDVDEFLALRDDADEATIESLGDPPAVGELVSDEWFVQRDMTLLMLWNERHPASARSYCELIAGS